MPRSNWKGNIVFGLVNIPIVLYNSELPTAKVSFKQINRKTGDKIKYKRVDTLTEEEVPWEHIGKAYEYTKDLIIPVEENELKRVAGENARTIAIESFIDKNNITFRDIDQTYYLVPDKKGEKGYVILREALEKEKKLGIAKVIISTKEYLAALAPFENALVLYLLRYQDEIRKLSEFNLPSHDYKKNKVTTKEIEIAKKLIASMTEKWKPEKYKDEFKRAIATWAEKKVKHLPATTYMKSRAKGEKPIKTIDFIDLLKKSLQQSKPQKASSKLKVSSHLRPGTRPSQRKVH